MAVRSEQCLFVYVALFGICGVTGLMRRTGSSWQVAKAASEAADSLYHHAGCTYEDTMSEALGFTPTEIEQVEKAKKGE